MEDFNSLEKECSRTEYLANIGAEIWRINRLLVNFSVRTGTEVDIQTKRADNKFKLVKLVDRLNFLENECASTEFLQKIGQSIGLINKILLDVLDGY